MKHDKSVVFFLLYWVLYSGLIRKYVFNHEIFSIIPDCILLYLFIRTSQYKEKQKLSKFIKQSIPILCCSFLILGTISMLINGCYIIPYFWNIRLYLRALFIFCIIWKTMNINDCWKYRKIMYYAFLPNLICGIIEYFIGKGGDALGGLFIGGNMAMLLYLVPMTFFASIDYYHGLLSKFKFLSIICTSLLLSFWGEIKLLYIIIPLFWYISNILCHKFRLKQILILAIGLIIFIPVMQFFLSFSITQIMLSLFLLSSRQKNTLQVHLYLGKKMV